MWIDDRADARAFITDMAERTRIQDRFAIFTRNELRDAIRTRLRRRPAKQQQSLIQNPDTVSRRDFLKLLGITGAGAVAASAGLPFARDILDGRPTPAGMISASEGSDITSQVENAASGGGTASIPAGRYRMQDLSIGGSGWTVEGAGVDSTTIVLPAGANLQLTLQGSGWSFGNLRFDVAADNGGSWENNAAPTFDLRGGNWELHDIAIDGITGSPEIDGKQTLMVHNLPEGSTGTIRNYVHMDGSAPPSGSSNTTYMLTSYPWDVNGKLVFDNFQLGHAANDPLYIWGSGGQNSSNRIEILNSYFKNTNVAAARIHGNTLIENTVVDQTGTAPKTGDQAPCALCRNQRGFWAGSNGVKPGKVVVRNTDIIISGDYRALNGSSQQGWEVVDCCIVGDCTTNGDGSGSIIRNSCIDGQITGFQTENVQTSGCNCRTQPPEPTATSPSPGTGGDTPPTSSESSNNPC